MTDWKLLAVARNLHLPDSDLKRIAPVLDALDAALQPLLAQVRYEEEPALILSEGALRGE